MEFVDLDRLAATALVREPFDHVVVPGFVPVPVLPALIACFPAIADPGSFAVDDLDLTPDFAAFVASLQSAATATTFGRVFGLDLTGHPTMVTLRGQSREADGRIHTDSATKIVTALIYLNGPWGAEGGRLRLLRSADDLDDVAVEVPPEDGTLVAFRRSERSFHGHERFVGVRRVVQINWMRDAAVARSETARHRRSARFKRLAASLGFGRAR